jgi:hypothetical protein
MYTATMDCTPSKKVAIDVAGIDSWGVESLDPVENPNGLIASPPLRQRTKLTGMPQII